MSDPYTDPAGVLHNKLGLADATALEVAETRIVAVRDVEIATQPIPGLYDLTHLQAIHRRLFGDVYAWAGELRTINIAKGTTLFCRAAFLQSYAAESVFPLIAASNHLRDLDQASVAGELARQLAEVNMLHPFREGNGRAQRIFFRQFAAAAGWRLDWPAADPQRNTEACIAAVAGSSSELEILIAEILSPFDQPELDH